MKMKKGYQMPRPRKYDYQKDYPVKMKIYVTLPVETANKLEEKGYDSKELSNLVEKYLVKFAEKTEIKD